VLWFNRRKERYEGKRKRKGKMEASRASRFFTSEGEEHPKEGPKKETGKEGTIFHATAAKKRRTGSFGGVGRRLREMKRKIKKKKIVANFSAAGKTEA